MIGWRFLMRILPIAILSFATLASADMTPMVPANAQSRVQRGFALAPVHLNLKGKNHDLVGLGSYIVNAQGACNDCHTCPPYTPDHDPYTGGDGRPNAENYLAGGV